MTSLPGAGAHRFWGFSPALDLLAEAPEAPTDPDALRRFLLLSPGDPRHVLRTLGALARLRGSGTEQGDAPTLEFSVYEQQPELLARHLLLLAVALDFEIPRRERAELLLELFANSLLREKTSSYLAARAAALRRLVTENEGPLVPLVDLSMLKMRDRDALHDVLSTWGEDVPVDMVRLRDERLRRLYKDRYDSRRNVLDWDYQMGLVPLASIVHKLHFREWRQTGIAFELRDSAYTAPNRSLISMAAGRERGRSVMRRGFWGDVASSPWAAVGVECDEPRLYKKQSDQHTKNACDVAYYNVLSWLTELETGKPYEIKEEDIGAFEYAAGDPARAPPPPPFSRHCLRPRSSVATAVAQFLLSPGPSSPAPPRCPTRYGSSVATPMLPKGFLNKDKPGSMPTVEEVAAADEEPAAAAAAAAADSSAVEAEAEAEAEKAREVVRRVVSAKMAKLPRFRLRLLSGDWAEVVRKPRHQKQFEVLALGSHVAHLLIDSRLNGLLAPRAATLVETAKFIVEVHKTQREQFSARAVELGALLGWSRHAETTAALASNLEMGPAHPAQLRFEYNEVRAPALAAEAKKLLEQAGKGAAAGGAPLELTDASAEGADTADGETAVDVGPKAAAGGGGGAAGVAGMLGKLAVQEEAAADAQPEEAAAEPVEPPAPRRRPSPPLARTTRYA